MNITSRSHLRQHRCSKSSVSTAISVESVVAVGPDTRIIKPTDTKAPIAGNCSIANTHRRGGAVPQQADQSVVDDRRIDERERHARGSRRVKQVDTVAIARDEHVVCSDLHGNSGGGGEIDVYPSIGVSDDSDIAQRHPIRRACPAGLNEKPASSDATAIVGNRSVRDHEPR